MKSKLGGLLQLGSRRYSRPAAGLAAVRLECRRPFGLLSEAVRTHNPIASWTPLVESSGASHIPPQWLRHVRGTACRRLSGMHRSWRRSVASWRLYFFGRRSTMIRRSWLYCTVLLSARDYWLSAILLNHFVFLFFFSFFLILYGAPAMSLTW